MLNTTPKIWDATTAKQLVTVLSSTAKPQDMQNFLRDVLTDKEIAEISARLEAARLLTSGTSYTQVTAITKLSSRTVARISTWMKQGAGGYAHALTIINHHAPQTSREGEA